LDWTGLIPFIMILLKCIAISIPEEFLHVFTYACTDIIHVPPISGNSRRQTCIVILFHQFFKLITCFTSICTMH
jgi:hypothetical protein